MKLTKEIILNTAEELILNNGFEQTSLTDIAKKLSVTHAALYKYYRNKDDVFENLALRWLEESMKDIFEWQPKDSPNALHDWLWSMTNIKKELYHSNPKMFMLYTQFIEKNERLVSNHIEKLAKKSEQIDANKNGLAVITAFTFFHNPYFADRWDRPSYKSEFENLWILMAQSS
jgi:AcrR family transcriptional regulator